MDNTADVFVHTPTNGVMKSLKEVRLRQQCGPGFGSKGCIRHAILNKGERLFQKYIWKADKSVAESKFCYPMFACEGKL